MTESMDEINARHMHSMGIDPDLLGKTSVFGPDARCESIHPADGVRCALGRGHKGNHARGRMIWEPLKTREGDQPLPETNDYPAIQDLVIEDIEERKQVGLQRYGTLLQPRNGRDSLQDAYEEALDLAIYLKQLLVERELDRLEAEA